MHTHARTHERTHARLTILPFCVLQSFQIFPIFKSFCWTKSYISSAVLYLHLRCSCFARFCTSFSKIARSRFSVVCVLFCICVHCPCIVFLLYLYFHPQTYLPDPRLVNSLIACCQMSSPSDTCSQTKSAHKRRGSKTPVMESVMRCPWGLERRDFFNNKEMRKN